VIPFLRYLDFVVLAIALPIFIVAGWPMLGYAVGGGIWIIQRGLQAWLTQKAETKTDVKTSVGILAGSIVGRGWLVALTIFAVGLNDNDAGLAAAVLVIALFTVYFTVNMIIRPIENAAAKEQLS
jgi:hypothetical protein